MLPNIEKYGKLYLQKVFLWNKQSVNFDGAIFDKDNSASLGVVIWNNEGYLVMASLSQPIPSPPTVIEVETLATRWAPELAANDIHFLTLHFLAFNLSHVCRHCNKVAHSFATKKKKIFPHPCMFGWKMCYQKLFLCYKLIWTIPLLLGIVPTSLLWPNFLLLWAFLPSNHTVTTVVTIGISFQRGLAIATELWLRGTLSLAIPRKLGSNGVAFVKHILLRSMLFLLLDSESLRVSKHG